MKNIKARITEMARMYQELAKEIAPTRGMWM